MCFSDKPKGGQKTNEGILKFGIYYLGNTNIGKFVKEEGSIWRGGEHIFCCIG